MGEPRIVITLMNSDGEIYEKFLPNTDGQTTIITQLARDRFKPFHSEESQIDLGKQLARFYCSNLRLLFEPFCEGVTIEPPYSDPTTAAFGGRVVIPPFNPTDNSHYFVCLRPEDIIHFETQNLQIRYSLQGGVPETSAQAKMPPAVVAPEDVQVKSSDPRRADDETEEAPHPDSETEDEDEEGDPDRTNTPVNVTSASSPPTATGEVKETPSHARHDDDAPFSTARDRPDDSGSDRTSQANGKASSEIELTGDVDGNLIGRGGKRRVGGSKQSPTSRIQSFYGEDFPGSSGFSGKTYAGRSRRNTPDKRADIAEDDDEDDSLDVVDQQDGLVSEKPTEPTSSSVLHPEGPAREAAKRSMSSKRKLRSSAGEDDGKATKARKVSSEQVEDGGDAVGDATAKQDDEDGKVEDEESDDDGPSQIEAGPRVGSGRLPRVARTEESDEDNIVAKPKKTATRPKSSPEVVVRAQRGSKSTSKTPAGTASTPSSTATSSLPGKPPKILISGMAPPSAPMAKFLKAQGSTIITSVPSRRTNFLCMVKDEMKLPRTPKVLRSLALGKKIVTERWINASKSDGELLDTEDFLHPELADSVDVDRKNLFNGTVLYFTNAAVKEYGSDNWQEMKELATEAGASSVESGSGAKGGKMTGRNSIIYIGLSKDPDATVLIEEHGRVVYHKDLVKEAVVSGELDLDGDEYKVAAGPKKTGRR